MLTIYPRLRRVENFKCQAGVADVDVVAAVEEEEDVAVVASFKSKSNSTQMTCSRTRRL